MNREHKRLVDRLESSGEDLLSYLGKFSEQEILEQPAPNEWSIHQVVAHLRDTEERVFLYRVRRLLKEDHPEVPNFDQDAWQREHYSPTEPFKKMLADFRSARRKQIVLLRKTTDKDWDRTARHPEYGVISVNWLVNHNVNHTFEHLSQIGYWHEKSLLKKLNNL